MYSYNFHHARPVWPPRLGDYRVDRPATVQASDDKFASVERCPALDELLTATPNTTSGLGNFTEVPELSIITECPSNSSLYLLDGESLAEALADPTPLLKVRSAVLIQAPGTLSLRMGCCGTLLCVADQGACHSVVLLAPPLWLGGPVLPLQPRSFEC